LLIGHGTIRKQLWVQVIERREEINTNAFQQNGCRCIWVYLLVYLRSGGYSNTKKLHWQKQFQMMVFADTHATVARHTVGLISVKKL
jgi:hypothetical protein